jgi:hypothetical protein
MLNYRKIKNKIKLSNSVLQLFLPALNFSGFIRLNTQDEILTRTVI